MRINPSEVRKMGRTKKPRKAYRPRGVMPQGTLRLQPWKLNASFEPLERLLDQIERGAALDVSDDGIVTYYAPDVGRTYHLVDSVRGLAETYDIARLRGPACPGTEALHRFADKVEREEALTVDDIQACRSSLTELRRFTANMPISQMTDLVNTAVMKFSLDEVAAANGADNDHA
ncbi:hypothetical protein D9M68_853620 [compost metagenome]